MKKKTSNRGEHTDWPAIEQRRAIWRKIRSDPEARRAFERLADAGFPTSHRAPNDVTLGYADYIAALPLLPNKPATRRIYSKVRLRKHWPLVEELRRFAATVNGSSFVDLTIFGAEDFPDLVTGTLQGDLLKAATILEHFLSWDYCVRNLNPRQALIAELRWTIRERTGKPHDRDLNALIDAAFKAAGYKDGCEIDATTLDRIERRQKESRVKAFQRIRGLSKTSLPTTDRSIRNRQKSRKRV